MLMMTFRIITHHARAFYRRQCCAISTPPLDDLFPHATLVPLVKRPFAIMGDIYIVGYAQRCILFQACKRVGVSRLHTCHGFSSSPTCRCPLFCEQFSASGLQMYRNDPSTPMVRRPSRGHQYESLFRSVLIIGKDASIYAPEAYTNSKVISYLIEGPFVRGCSKTVRSRPTVIQYTTHQYL